MGDLATVRRDCVGVAGFLLWGTLQSGLLGVLVRTEIEGCGQKHLASTSIRS